MLINCPECDSKVSDKAFSCPACGYPIKRIMENDSEDPDKRRRRSKNKRMKLPNGFGRITELKDKNLRKPFRAMVSDGKDINGRPIGRLLKPIAYFETYNEAYKALMQYHENPYNFSDDITMEELYERWLEKRKGKISKGRLTSLEAAWKYCSMIYDVKVQKIRGRDIKNVLDNGYKMVKGVKQTASDYTKIDMKTLLTSMLSYAVEYDIIAVNPAKAVKNDLDQVSKNNSPHITFTDDEFASILKELGKNEFADMAYVQCYMGWRPSELLDIKTQSVNMAAWSITGGGKTKSGTDREVPVHTNIRSIVQHYYTSAIMTGTEYLFPYNGRHMSYGIYRGGFDSLVKRNGMNENHRPHDCRKQFVTMAKKAGVDEYAVKKIVGHKISDITESVYTDRDIKWLHSEISKIP